MVVSLHRRWLIGLAGVLTLGLAGGCRAKVEIQVLPDEAPARRTAASFVHCVEMGTSQCVTSEQTAGGWDAFYLLAWLSDGSPVSILDALPAELARHQDPKYVQARLVDEVERYASTIRGAECSPSSMQEIGPLIDKAAAVASNRLAELGLWQGNLAKVVQGLAEEAHEDLDGGQLVKMDCSYDPHRLYVASTRVEGVNRVVGMTTFMPQHLGGDIPDRDFVSERLQSRALGLSLASAPITEGTISPWMPFPVEIF